MAQPLLTNSAVTMPQEEPRGPTPYLIQPPTMVPGQGLPSTGKPPPVGPDTPPTNDRGRGPMPPPESTPMPKPNPQVVTPMPKPNPTVVGGAGTAPPAAATTPGGGSAPTFSPAWGGGGGGGSGGSIDFRRGVAETNTDAMTRTVNDNELTSRQLSRLIDENGRFIQNARLSARESAAGSGMLLSGVAVGNAERAAIDAAAPIAQADAGVFANTASENMRAGNDDRLADQMAGRSLLSQSESQMFQSGENATNRSFQSAESAAGRAFQSAESATERGWRSEEGARDRSQQFLMQERGFSFQDAQAAVERGWRSNEAVQERGFTGQQNEAQRQSARIAEFNQLMGNREAGLSNQLSAIFSNTALNPSQQQAAAANARALFTSTAASFNAAFAQGVPSIFFRPYEMQQPTPGTQPTQPTQPVQPATQAPLQPPTGRRRR